MGTGDRYSRHCGAGGTPPPPPETDSPSAVRGTPLIAQTGRRTPVERGGNVNLRRSATMSGAMDHTARPQPAANRPTAAAAAAATGPCPAYFRPTPARRRSLQLAPRPTVPGEARGVLGGG